MFNELYKLYGKRNSNRTPLEDFNTECFAGVLRMSPDILDTFTKFLKLPEGKYAVSTQAHYSLEANANCIIDMVLESESHICFIENKVNSNEGWQQLSRYCEVLEKYYNAVEVEHRKETHLRYCTKNVDIKQENEYKHKFHQFRWFQVGKLLADHKSDALGTNYLNFLQQNDMAIDPSISTDTVVTLKNYAKTADTMKYYLDESANNFKIAFPNADLADRNKSKVQNELIQHKRLSNSIERPLIDKTIHSEILYSIEFKDVCLQTQIWIESGHKQLEAIKNEPKTLEYFEFIESSNYGLGLRNRKPLYAFIESPNSEQDIKNWFKESFEKVRAFINSTPGLGWSDKVGEKK